MSTFTNWNGPQGSDVRASDLIELAKQYSKLVTELNKHMTDDINNTNVHNAREYINSLITDVRSEIPSLEGYAHTSDIPSLEGYATKTELDRYVTNEALDNSHFATKIELDNYLLKSELASQQIIESIMQDINNIEQYINSNIGTKPILRATQYVETILLIADKIKTNYTKISAPVGGSDSTGVYYILGMLDVDTENESSGSGVLFLRYFNTTPFSAKIDFAVRESHTVINADKYGALDIVATKSGLENLKFKIVGGTDSDSNGHTYIAIQSTDWIPQFANSENSQLFTSIDFEVSGINFIPVGDTKYVAPNGTCHDIYSKYAESSGIGIGIGIIEMWPFFEEVLNNDTQEIIRIQAVNVPSGYHACDGSEVLESDDVSKEFRELFTNYPLVDFSIIKTKP